MFHFRYAHQLAWVSQFTWVWKESQACLEQDSGPGVLRYSNRDDVEIDKK